MRTFMHEKPTNLAVPLVLLEPNHYYQHEPSSITLEISLAAVSLAVPLVSHDPT